MNMLLKTQYNLCLSADLIIGWILNDIFIASYRLHETLFFYYLLSAYTSGLKLKCTMLMKDCTTPGYLISSDVPKEPVAHIQTTTWFIFDILALCIIRNVVHSLLCKYNTYNSQFILANALMATTNRTPSFFFVLFFC